MNYPFFAYMARLKLARTGRATIEDSPLAAGLGMAALGAAVALMFRPTEAEDRLMGATRDLVVDQARQRARGEAEKAGDLARNLAQAVMRANSISTKEFVQLAESVIGESSVVLDSKLLR